jgi:hypothetical protein
MKKNKNSVMRKGYLYVILFALFSSIARAFYFRIFIAKDLSEITYGHLVIQMLLLFITFLIPGLLAVRWYYRLKDKNA